MRKAPVVGRGAPASEAPPDAALEMTAPDEVGRAVARAAEVLRARPSGLVTDLDGTLGPIVATPEEAFVLPDCRAALRRLARQIDLVAVVSGRPASEVRRLVGLRKLVYVGNHGLERWEEGRQKGRAASRPWRAALTAVADSLRRELAGLPGIRIEDKGVSFSVHYRAAPDHGRTRTAVLTAVRAAADPHRLSVREAKKVVEVGPPDWPGKAEAVIDLFRSLGLRSLVYLGDDAPDMDVFRRLAGLRAEGFRALTVAVDSAEAPPGLTRAADLVLAGPEDVGEFLLALDMALGPANGRSPEGPSGHAV